MTDEERKNRAAEWAAQIPAEWTARVHQNVEQQLAEEAAQERQGFKLLHELLVEATKRTLN